MIAFAPLTDRASALRRAERHVWLACLLTAVALYAATMAFGDLVQRSHLRGWAKTRGTVVAAATPGQLAVRYVAGGQSRDLTLSGWLGTGRELGDQLETWYDPQDPKAVVVADTTPLHTFRVATGIGVIAIALVAGLLIASSRLRRVPGASPMPPEASAPPARTADSTAAREWLVAAAVPLAICVGALGWIVFHPEIEGDTQLGLAALTYAAALFGVRKWLRATRAVGAQGKDAA